MSDRLHYASIADPNIKAITHEMYRLPTAEVAMAKLDALKDSYIVSKQQIDNDGHPSVILWIKGWEVSADEDKEGYFGHFAVVSFKRASGGRYTLYALKQASELKNHPQRKLIQRSTPNWGHPALRKIKAKKETFKTEALAQKALMKLHEEFPTVTVPNPGRLYILIYSKETKPPVKKYVLEIKPLEKGTFLIDCREKKNEPRRKITTSEMKDNTQKKPVGKFTATIKGKRSGFKNASKNYIPHAKEETTSPEPTLPAVTPEPKAEENITTIQTMPEAIAVQKDSVVKNTESVSKEKQTTRKKVPGKSTPQKDSVIGKFTSRIKEKRLGKK